MTAKLTPDQMHTLADYLRDTCNSIESGLTSMDLDLSGFDVSNLESDLLDYDLERCEGCDWWFECSELVGGFDDEPGFCEDCRE